MLVLSRKPDETIVIDGDIRITVVGLRGRQVRLGIEAPGAVGIYRQELYAPAVASREAGDLRPDRAPNRCTGRRVQVGEKGSAPGHGAGSAGSPW
jgi:carbon storage regulator